MKYFVPKLEEIGSRPTWSNEIRPVIDMGLVGINFVLVLGSWSRIGEKGLVFVER